VDVEIPTNPTDKPRGRRRKTADAAPAPAEQIAAPGEALPPLPDEAYPEGAAPLPAAAPLAPLPEGAINHRGVWLPPGEKHLVEMMAPGVKRYAELPDGRPSYQRHKFLTAVPLVKEARVFVDIGAHVGLWSMQAELAFEQVIAFEPHPVHAAIYPHNMRTDRYALHRVALGEREGSVRLDGKPGSSGDTHVAGEGDIPMVTLDSFGLERIDLLKIDTEGYELPILRGAVETLKRCRPVVVVEQKGREAMYHGGKQGEAVAFLKSLGMVELAPAISGDFFLGWR